MIPYLGCGAARAMLEAFVDGELAVDEQVALDAHLRWCDTCRARIDDLRLIGAALRIGPSPLAMAAADDAALASVHAQVLARIDAERRQSLGVRWREMCADTRLLWPALGATLALVLCVAAIAGVYGTVQAEHPRSLAALVSGRSVLPAPRALPPPPPPVVAPEGEAVFLISAAVASGGARVATYELLRSAREPADEASALVDALRDMRLAPPTATGGDATVWLLARTTVRASAEPAARPLSAAARPARRPARS